HLRITGREIAIRYRKARILLDREKKFRHSLIKSPSQEVRLAYYRKRRADAGARAQPQRPLDIRDRHVTLAPLQSQHATDVPTPREIRVENEGAVNQRDHGVAVLAEIAQHFSGVHQDIRVVACRLEGSSGEIDPLQTIHQWIIAPTVKH